MISSNTPQYRPEPAFASVLADGPSPRKTPPETLADPVFTPHGVQPAESLYDLLDALVRSSARDAVEHVAADAIRTLLDGGEPHDIGDDARQYATDLLLDRHQHRLLSRLVQAYPGSYTLNVGGDPGKAQTLQKCAQDWPEATEVALRLATSLPAVEVERLVEFLQQLPKPNLHLDMDEALNSHASQGWALLARSTALGELSVSSRGHDEACLAGVRCERLVLDVALPREGNEKKSRWATVIALSDATVLDLSRSPLDAQQCEPLLSSRDAWTELHLRATPEIVDVLCQSQPRMDQLHLHVDAPLLDVSTTFMALLALPSLGETVVHGAMNLVAWLDALGRHGKAHEGDLLLSPCEAHFVVPEGLSAQARRTMHELLEMLANSDHSVQLRHRADPLEVEHFRPIDAETEDRLRTLH
ncbi:hypothetical protein [Hydrogenophaga sp. BPS33]|uniref:hypothetical protein n=1 Tax=Hydrogenophaga sp. BPS33 TaxID=2651974 RepID=UPI00131FA964|nr:hypothetical protein [Hydrogenophaga sp. BPS33]QHE86344.1 hypothetical protein F9K07_16245 [Hydrogenophaga sp. BPS33]